LGPKTLQCEDEEAGMRDRRTRSNIKKEHISEVEETLIKGDDKEGD
jgi:hypothetical protein